MQSTKTPTLFKALSGKEKTMRQWKFKSVTTHAILKEAITLHNFMIIDDKKHIYYHHKYYTILETETAENGTIYHTECVRHTGKKHIKFSTTFIIQPNAIGICESFFKEA